MMHKLIEDTLLCAYVDGELDPQAAREVEALAAHNPAVRDRIRMFRQSRNLLHGALSEGEFAEVPHRLQRSAERMIFRAKLRSWTRSVPRDALSAVAALLLGIGIGAALLQFIEHGTVLPRTAVAAVMHEVAEYHPVYAREVEHLVEVPASRREHIEEWLGDRVGLAFKAPDLSRYEFRYQGARLVALHDQVLAQLMYTGPNDQRIALCITKLKGRPSERLETLVEGGLKLLGVSKGGHVFLVVGPADEPIVERLAADLPGLLTS
jgi:anti-sigma factor RsiW